MGTVDCSKTLSSREKLPDFAQHFNCRTTRQQIVSSTRSKNRISEGNWEYNINILVLLCCVSCHAPGVVVNNVVVVSTVVVVGSTLVVFSAVVVGFMVVCSVVVVSSEVVVIPTISCHSLIFS